MNFASEMNERTKETISRPIHPFFCFSKSLFTFLLPFVLIGGCHVRTSETQTSHSLNRLAAAGSPYLREHADNPVDWYEWGSEAMDKAKKENKPLIISIGYASCHWCHVMERESFMDTTVARIMNENFVSIKIDREERPDIDQIYLNAAQLISGNAGWPLNAFALPDGRPFHAATYFPKEQWIRMLQQVISAYENENDNILKQAESLTKGIQTSDLIPEAAVSSQNINQKLYRNIYTSWSSLMDMSSGGLKGSPKFPMPVIWEYLLQHQHLTKDKNALDMVTVTLDKMAMGGIFDQLGGGFSRYTTDEQWKVPHFEKMLYDNAQLVSLYAHAYQVNRKPLYGHVIEKTLAFIEAELTSPTGGFYSSINADSENEEGKFYVWTKKEIDDILDPESAKLFTKYYQVKDSGNWEYGKNILYSLMEKREFAERNGMDPFECTRILEQSEDLLLQARNRRIRPSVDDKILVAWNALMIKGYVDAYFSLGNPAYLQKALTSARFIEKYMVDEDGRLWRNYKDGQARIPAFLDDYAFLAKAFIFLYQATFDLHWLDQAKKITDYAIAHFRSEETGMFYYTSDDAENLVARKMELADNVIPSSNSVLAEVTFLLGEYYQQAKYTDIGTSMVNRMTDQMTTAGPYYANWASLAGVIAYKPYEVAIMGSESQEKAKQLLRNYIPAAIFMGGTSENLPLLRGKLVKGRTIIYVCRNNTCKLPEEDVALALTQLNK
jgi:uncharacterized protein